MAPSFPGLKAFLTGNQVTSKNDTVLAADGTKLPTILHVTVHKAENLYKPTLAAMVKFNPYVSCYLTPNKLAKQSTEHAVFSTASPTFDTVLSFTYKGEPLLVVQAWDADMIRHEFIGESPMDLMSVINSSSRSWTGPVTVWGKKGTMVRGSVWVTVQFEGGTPYDPSYPAAHVSQTELFDPKLASSPLTNITSAAKQAAWCC
ncbi:C2 domain protein [Gregarina niphandrodes]|uniref:C2 domain protein n=1 Tax=Gregarina niphandrodes TaxID=110365 RepID=A0A023BDK9_GRENI|nr:C2 domain protein [Gregarina niphandrodes]EZG89223.1 C2 domain protein [Gregarina niphandrodes]|eukprot:XP_011128494.1 C2 domain protein [Gregarina niphandrodes]